MLPSLTVAFPAILIVAEDIVFEPVILLTSKKQNQRYNLYVVPPLPVRAPALTAKVSCSPLAILSASDTDNKSSQSSEPKPASKVALLLSAA